MMKGRVVVISIVAILLASIGIVQMGCNKSEDSQTATPVAVPLQPVPAGSLQAYSASSTSVGLAWAPTPDAGQADFQAYQIKFSGGGRVDSVTVAKSNTDALVVGLSDGVIYTFEISARAVPGSASFTNSSSASIRWSPARRYENESGQPAPIKVYETTSSGTPSGLIFFRASNAGPQTVSVIGADTALVDVYVRTEANSGVSINSSSVFRPGRRLTRFSTTTRNASSLNNPQVIPPDTATYQNFSYLVDSAQVASSKILYYKGQDGNYGRILLERNPSTGLLIWGSSPDQYLSMRISYQSVPYNPYAKPQSSTEGRKGE